MKRTIFLIIIILLMVLIVGLYVYDIVIKDVSPTKNLFRTICILLAGMSSLVKLYNPNNKRSLQFYQLRYADILGNAFADQPGCQKRLLKAIRTYNQNAFMRAVKQLERLKPHCQNRKDHYAVHLFIALCYTDARLSDQAETVYKYMISKNYADSLVYSNLGHLKLSRGKYNEAISNFEYALSLDPENAHAYHNLATVYFNVNDLETAAEYAQKALEINGKMREASTLLAIIYALKDERVSYEKYFHIAVSAGQNPDEIKRAISYYQGMQENIIA